MLLVHPFRELAEMSKTKMMADCRKQAMTSKMKLMAATCVVMTRIGRPVATMPLPLRSSATEDKAGKGLAPRSSHPVQAAWHFTKQHAEATQRKGHGLGSPHVYALSGLLDARTTMKIPGAQLIWEEFKKLSDIQKGELCLFCRMSKVFKEEDARITFAFDHKQEGQRLQTAVMSYIDLMGMAEGGEAAAAEKPWTRKVGRAHASHQERELQRILEEMLEDQEA